ncbi:MAG: hypothetical protein K2L97_07565, partial [Muribaculaceae bacterium]|nr:hypothetical protein [Muribaculaceae bacterium]
GIRTLGTRKGTTVFETVPIDHSGIFPNSRRRSADREVLVRLTALFSAISITISNKTHVKDERW